MNSWHILKEFRSSQVHLVKAHLFKVGMESFFLYCQSFRTRSVSLILRFSDQRGPLKTSTIGSIYLDYEILNFTDKISILQILFSLTPKSW